MGWYYCETNKNALVEELTKTNRSEDGKRVHLTLAKSVRGNTLYTVHEILSYENGEEKSERYIGVYLLSQQGGDWGYKPMDESMGPCVYDCPLKFFELAPIVPGGYAASWRASVRSYHERKKTKRGAKVGDTLVFKKGVTFHGHPLIEEKVTEVRGTKVYFTAFGYKVRVMPKHIERIERE